MAKVVVNPDAADPTDGDLIARSRRAPDLFAEIFDRHHRAVHAYAARRAGTDAADDVLAEVFLTAFSRRTTFDAAVASALPWLYGIAGNVLKRRWRTLVNSDRLQRSVAGQAIGTAESHEDQVADRLDSATDWVVVRGVLGELADGDRDAILLFAWEELSYPEIATALGIPVGTVRSRIHRARVQLRDALGDTLEVGR